MEFPFNVSQALEVQKDGFAVIDKKNQDPPSDSKHNSPAPIFSTGLPRPDQENLAEIINTIGKLSIKAQGLKNPLTTYTKFLSRSSQRIYIKADSYKVYGFIKVETKKLALKDPNGDPKESKFVCVLDFYVHESVQRKGFGKLIFDKMLKTEKKQAFELAYKRTSVELLSFLKKYYGLINPIPQSNGYTIFSLYWEIILPKKKKHPTRNKKTEEYRDIQNVKENEDDNLEYNELKNFGIDADDTGENIEREENDGSNMSLIDLLLRGPSVLENNVFKKLKGTPAKKNEEIFFPSESAERFYEKLTAWHDELQKDISKEKKYFKERNVTKIKSDTTMI